MVVLVIVRACSDGNQLCGDVSILARNSI